MGDHFGFYPCVAHTHATKAAYERCIGPAVFDEIPEIGLKGWITGMREPEENSDE